MFEMIIFNIKKTQFKKKKLEKGNERKVHSCRTFTTTD